MNIDTIRDQLKEHIVGDPRPLLWFAGQIGVNRITLADFFYNRRRTTYETALKVVEYLDKKKEEASTCLRLPASSGSKASAGNN